MRLKTLAEPDASVSCQEVMFDGRHLHLFSYVGSHRARLDEAGRGRAQRPRDREDTLGLGGQR